MSLIHSAGRGIAGFANRIREINRHYATPRIQMSGLVRVALLVLRIYLFVLVGLLAYKFFTILSH